MLNFLDELKEGYAKADKALGGFLPGGGTGNPLSNTVREGALGARDAIVEKADPQLHEELFVKAHTGGASGDGVIKELPDNVLGAIKRQISKKDRLNGQAMENIKNMEEHSKKIIANPELATNPFEVGMAEIYLKSLDEKKAAASDSQRKTHGHLELYTSGNVEAHLGLGSIGVYFDKNGNVTIKDTWKVDGYNNGEGRVNPDGTKGVYGDLAEGGYIASDAHDLARTLGVYKDIPIEVKLTKKQWEAIVEDKPYTEESKAGYQRKTGIGHEYKKKRNKDLNHINHPKPNP